MKTASMPPGEYTPKPTFTKIKKAREAVPKIKESENFKTSLLTKSNIKTIIPKTTTNNIKPIIPENSK